MKRRLRRVGWLVGAAVGALAVAAFARSTGGTSGERLAVVTRGDLVLGAELSGNLEAVDSELVGPPQIPHIWNFKIAWMAPEGSEVRRGMPVLRFDTSELERRRTDKLAERDSAAKELEKKTTDLERARREAELHLAEARARLRRAELKVAVPPELSQAKELEKERLDRDLAADEVAYLEHRAELDAEQGKAELDDLRKKHDRAADRLAEIDEYIRRMAVRAPRDGTVIYVSRRGEKRKPGDQVWQQEKVIEIPDLAQMRLAGEVDEADAGRVRVGQRVTLHLDAHPDVEYSGRVERLHRTVERKSRRNPLKVVRLEVALDRTDVERMRPGMRVRGTVEIERLTGVLLAPADAVFSTAAGPVAFRRTLWGSEDVRPEVGRRNDRFVEIRSGLAEGDRLFPHVPEGWEAGR